MSTPTHREVIRQFREIAEKMTDSVKRDELLRDIDELERIESRTEQEKNFRARSQVPARKASSLFRMAISGEPDAMEVELPRSISNTCVVLAFSMAGGLLFGYMPWWDERTKHVLLGLALISAALVLLILVACRAIMRIPLLTKRGKVIRHDAQPIRYWAFILFGATIGIVLLMAGSGLVLGF